MEAWGDGDGEGAKDEEERGNAGEEEIFVG